MIAAFGLFALVACDDTTTTTADSGHGDHGTHAETCGEPGDHYLAGMTALGADGLVELTLVSSDPGPPEKGDNVFVVSVASAADGAVLQGAGVVLRPWMPEHGHGSSPETFSVVEGATVGEFQAEGVDLFMGGLWELAFEVESAAGDIDTATFTFCVEG